MTVASGFDALGKPVPFSRRDAAYQALKDMVPEWSNEDRFSIVQRVSDALERDEPYQALRLATNAPFDRGLNAEVDAGPGPFLDVTGGYRLVAHLLTGGEHG